ncbi:MULTISPECIES: class I SAM-dependent methyltransferase [unclassified Janthinobacterium]|uniref:class I SAM-dependent methyltransferase n=1 Tax=unclassified Janthinobacterium TaxID=2610881 RepID=UPI00034DD1E8|nr:MULTISPECIES: methyltransferase [unclassified Janthinobacterium]MEC5161194.1 2-polyprenyl-3-methyl-5-hydroxy-6-metoxy-1,4-benzoquinol methylase [Janthinobacterium sp. CG_S6]
MDDKQYGTRAWIESRYAASADDPWGLDWRPSQRYRYARMLAALETALAGAARPLAIVDVGCATGTFTALLAGLNGGAAGASLVGVDIAAAAVARAAARHPHLRFERLALDDCARAYAGAADLVTCMEVLYYLPARQRLAALRQLKGMLRPGGCLLVSSMIAAPPYFSAEQLGALVGGELALVDSGVLYLKPLALWEKLQMKLRRGGTPGAAGYEYAAVERWGRYAARLLPGFARSHAYVIARAA